MPGRRRVRRRVWIPAPEPAAAPPLRPPLPPARAAASSEDAPVKGRGGADGCCAQSMAMADLLVQEQLHDVPDAEVGKSSEMDTPFRGGVFQTGSGKAVLLGKDSIQKATATLQGLGFPGYPAAVPAGYIIPQVPYNVAVNYGPNGYAAAGGGGGRYQNNKPAATMAAAPPPTDLFSKLSRFL